MKKAIATRLAGALFAAVALCLSSCSSKPSASDIYSLASYDDLAVARVNATTIIENAGGTITPDGIDFPAELMNGMSKETRTVLTARGIDLEYIVANVTADNEIGVAFHISDQKAFDEYLTEVFPNTSVNEEKGYTFRKVGDETYVFTNSGTGYMLQADDNGVDRLEELMEHAKACPVADWQKTAMEDGNAFGLVYNVSKVIKMMKEKKEIDIASNKAIAMQYDPEEFATSFVKINASLDGAKLTANSEIVSAKGNPLKSKLDTRDIDSSLLKYADDKDQMVFMMSLPTGIDWKEMVEAFVELSGNELHFKQSDIEAIASVLDNIDGTVMMAFGVNGKSKASDFDGVIAVQFKEGAAEEYLKQLHSLASAYGSSFNLSVEMTNTLSVKGMGFEAYAKVEGNSLVISLHPITGEGGCAISASLFSGKNAVFALDIAKDDQLAGIVNMPFGINANACNEGNGGALNVQLTGVAGGLIENLLRLSTSR